ncbi:MAG: bifunctional (p)ppGpp synthetase/guanosine-3',5'-bis(diphosphate) 3'-pyrophosphohydrolase [Myxococcales bacterium]|nr:bifunctional (p)ppGpp synthetase/guanosine-3',5'-bis(diphosphate) 3'-pyrophosphohydrolase [Myxococcales bacterium]
MPAEFSSRTFLDALNFAALRHREQRRKGEQGAPYVNHLIEVAHVLASHGVDGTDILCAAVLHDVVEDTSATAEELRRRFGNRVASIVLEVTDDARIPLWERKLVQIEAAHTLSEDAQNLRVADKISNLRGILVSPPEQWSLERKLAYYAWAQKVVDGCDRASPALRRTFADVYESGLAALHVRGTLGA